MTTSFIIRFLIVTLFESKLISHTEQVRSIRSFDVSIPSITRRRLLHWADQFPSVCWLDSCSHQLDPYGRFDWLFGVSRRSGFSSWEAWHQRRGDWVLGALPYEWKSAQDPRLASGRPADIEWPGTPGFTPELLMVKLRNSNRVWILKQGILGWEEALMSETPAIASPAPPAFRANFTRDQYIGAVQALREHIREGNCYEVNLAQMFSAAYSTPHPHRMFESLVDVSPVPFAAYLKSGSRHLISASPERFLQQRKGTLITQPIKGTAPRGGTPERDKALVSQLLASDKERAENVMIVDLSRHDLNRFCRTRSVKVPHLFEIQSFPQVHQMVSTIEGELRDDTDPLTALKGIFPPGSMTGAPKFRVMQLIDETEGIGRGLYAGSVGYLSPAGDFDFNVVIRSLIYDEAAERINYHVGGAITYDSDPVAEYEETILKAQAVRSIFA